MNPEEKINEGISLFAEGLSEIIASAAKYILAVFAKIPKSLIWEYHAKHSESSEIQKCYVIYKRTKSKRIKKKQKKRIVAILNK